MCRKDRESKLKGVLSLVITNCIEKVLNIYALNEIIYSLTLVVNRSLKAILSF